eukprot:UN00185
MPRQTPCVPCPYRLLRKIKAKQLVHLLLMLCYVFCKQALGKANKKCPKGPCGRFPSYSQSLLHIAASLCIHTNKHKYQKQTPPTILFDKIAIFAPHCKNLHFANIVTLLSQTYYVD